MICTKQSYARLSDEMGFGALACSVMRPLCFPTNELAMCGHAEPASLKLV